jgi:hypothetical protein
MTLKDFVCDPYCKDTLYTSFVLIYLISVSIHDLTTLFIDWATIPDYEAAIFVLSY